MISGLIDKQDGFEIIRDKIAAILVTEIANQQVLALADAKDPNLWKIRVYTERCDAWEQWLNDTADKSPICNIWAESASFDGRMGNAVNRQVSDTIYNLDCYAVGTSTSDGDGHIPGDKSAALNAHRALRLIRNILMADVYTYLDLRGTVGSKWIDSWRVFQPGFDSTPVANIIAVRLSLRVHHIEFTSDQASEILEYISVTTRRAEDGEILVQADYDFS